MFYLIYTKQRQRARKELEEYIFAVLSTIIRRPDLLSTKNILQTALLRGEWRGSACTLLWISGQELHLWSCHTESLESHFKGATNVFRECLLCPCCWLANNGNTIWDVHTEEALVRLTWQCVPMDEKPRSRQFLVPVTQYKDQQLPNHEIQLKEDCNPYPFSFLSSVCAETWIDNKTVWK